MSFDLPVLFFAGFAYLSLLFFIAYAADTGRIPAKIARHPLVYVLSLGVYATSWTYYGSVGFAETHGYNFLTVYLGVTLAFLASPVLLMPILRVVKEYQLASLADLMAFRYRSQVAGMLVTLFMLVGTLPYIALQIRAVTESMQVLTQEVPPQILALGFCVTVIVFAILFGARHISPREKHEGLVVAIAFESVVKLLALLLIGLFAVFGVFGGLGGMEDWLERHPEALEALYRPVREGPWASLMFLAFMAAFLLPRQFHMAFTENLNSQALYSARWGFPIFLLLLNLAIPPVLWAGTYLQLDMDADYYLLGISLQSQTPFLAILSFIGGIAAASGMMIVTTLALSHMCLNHLLLPASYPDPDVNLYGWLLWGRRVIIAIIVMSGFGYYALLEHNQGLVQLGLISFVAVAQFLPGIIGVLYWPRATRVGFILGLLGGIWVWAVTLLLPILENSGFVSTGTPSTIPDIDEMQALFGLDRWGFATFWSLAFNTTLFVIGSLITRPTQAEQEAAQACCMDSVALPRGVVTAASSDQFKDSLARALGREAAEKEVQQALEDLRMSPRETRPTELRRLRERLERNLSGLVGPQMAHMIVTEQIEMDSQTRTALADTMRYAESQLERSRSRLRGLAAELDTLRRYHRRILEDMPLGVCSLSPDGEVLIWNLAMEVLSGVARNDAAGSLIHELPEPWAGLLEDFLDSQQDHVHKVQISLQGRTHSYNLHKATIENTGLAGFSDSGVVILIEDLTDLESLESELQHSERLASIGRLAAGVAHEIGNPLTGIACLVQNLKEETDQEVLEESIDQILVQTRRIGDIVESLTTFSHSGRDFLPNEPMDLCLAIDEAVNLVRLSHSGKEVGCMNHCPSDLSIRGDQPRILQVLVNLLSNACDASRPGEQVSISGHRTAEHIELIVADHGEGIAEDLRERIFEPFFTTKNPGEGTGLGLPIVYRIVHDHGGSIRISDNRAETGDAERPGTRITLQFPAI